MDRWLNSLEALKRQRDRAWPMTDAIYSDCGRAPAKRR